jgi:hypothetical protein
MPDLLRLPLTLADYATRPARFVVGKLLELRGSDDDSTVQPVADRVPTPAAEEAERAPQTAPKPKPAARAKPKTKPKPQRAEPTKGQVAKLRQEQRMEEQNAGGPGPGPEIDVAPPWDGYDAMTEEQVLDRLTGADEAVRAAVRLYESFNGGRRQIILATDEVAAQ